MPASIAPLPPSLWVQRKRQADEGYQGSPFPSTGTDAAWQQDRARLIHCAAFRRLQSKTQVLGVGEGDFYRTRLTHSLEVAQLGSGISAQLAQAQPAYAAYLPSPMLIEAICLTHDLGHPPFGHGGEAALNTIMKDWGGFEGNGQTLRIAAKLGEYSERHGLDLTRRTLLGVLKYPAEHRRLARYPQTSGHSPATSLAPQAPLASLPASSQGHFYRPPKCIHDEETAELQWILAPLSERDRQRFTLADFADALPGQPPHHGKTRYKAFDTSIMELADDIAYGVHDLEDAVALRLVTETQWRAHVHEPALALPWASNEEKTAFENLLHFADAQLFLDGDKPRKHVISRIVKLLVGSIRIQPQNLFDDPLLDLQARMSDGPTAFLKLLKQFVMQYVILRPQLQELEYKGQRMLMQLLQTLLDNPSRLLPLEQQRLLQQGQPLHRTVCDYVASMTDLEAARRYNRLFAPGIQA